MAKKKIVKPVKKITKKKLLSLARSQKRKALADWSKAVRNRDDNKCVVCGHTEHLNAHHILPKETYKELMLEVMDGITLCSSHHKFGKFSAHKNGIWFSHWLKINRPEQYAWAIEHMND